MFVTRHEHNASQVFAVIAPWLYITLRNTHLRPTLNLYPHWALAFRSPAWICFQLLKGNSSFVRKIDLGQFAHLLFLSKIGVSAENVQPTVPAWDKSAQAHHLLRATVSKMTTDSPAPLTDLLT